MCRLVSRFILQWKKNMRQDEITEDDLLEIKQDISAVRCAFFLLIFFKFFFSKATLLQIYSTNHIIYLIPFILLDMKYERTESGKSIAVQNTWTA